MPRHRHARKNSSLPLAAPIPGPKDEISQAQPWVNPITGQDAEALLVHLLVDSDKLAFEPEFLDLEFDEQDSFDVMERHLYKYRKRLARAKLQGSEAFDQVSDEVHIKIVDELVTSDFRKELQTRLQALRERFELESDPEKLRMVLALQFAIQTKDFPPSMTGLVEQIYKRNVIKSLQNSREEDELMEGIESELGRVDADPQDVIDIFENPEKLKPIEEKLAKNPRLIERLEKKIWDMLDDFEKKLEKGQVELDLFTREEIYLPFNRLEEILGPDAQKFDGSTAAGQKRILEIVIETMDELFTPQRWGKFYIDVEETAHRWMRARHPWGAALRAELGTMDKNSYESNRFIVFAFWGQVRRLKAPGNSKPSKKR
jgi:hypothetical protein